MATEVANIAGFYADHNSTGATTITGPVLVVYKHGAYLFLQDKSGVLIVKGKIDKKLKRGDLLEGVTGEYEAAGGVANMVNPVSDSIKVVGQEKAPKPKNVSLAKITKRMHGTYVKIKDVEVKAGKKEYFYSLKDENGVKMTMLDRFRLKQLPVGQNCDVTGFVMVSPKGNIVLNATKVEMVEE
ncbi:MAG: hypothetical protein K2M65_03235 [Muribaculaceae bacterium]|nr:hypothetical protein [Muribaculaceae bacterium]